MRTYGSDTNAVVNSIRNGDVANGATIKSPLRNWLLTSALSLMTG